MDSWVHYKEPSSLPAIQGVQVCSQRPEGIDLLFGKKDVE
ncbi:hypothetical protein GGR92_003571 [Spirosoma lacussanchae]